MSVKVERPGEPEVYYFDERYVPAEEAPKPKKKAAKKTAKK